MNIAKNIKRIREGFGLTQADFGRIAGVSDKAVSKWELGLAEPRMGAIKKIEAGLGVTIFDITGERFADPGNDVDSLLVLYSQLNEEGQEKVLEYARLLKESGQYKKDHPFGMVEAEV